MVRYVKERYETFCYTIRTYKIGICPSVLFVFLAGWWFCCGGDSGPLSVSVYSLTEDGLDFGFVLYDLLYMYLYAFMFQQPNFKEQEVGF